MYLFKKLGQYYNHGRTLYCDIIYTTYIHDFINRNLSKHDHVPNPDCRELTELCALYIDSINYKIIIVY
jgi:hypothetical protein